MDYETARTIVLGAISVSAIVCAHRSRGDRALGFGLLALFAAIGVAA